MKRARAAVVVLLLLAGCGPEQPDGVPVAFTVPEGASFAAVADTLSARGLIGSTRAFSVYARVRGADRSIKSGRYRLETGSSWGTLLEALTQGRVLTVEMTIPEGFRLVEMAPRIAAISEVPSDSVMTLLRAPGAEERFGLPGPGLEGYLFPDTYRFAQGVAPRIVVAAMADRYRRAWSPERLARREALDLSEREVVTLASIIQAEARRVAEMPRISSVYHNRLERGWLLQADPTVLYALGGPRERLLYAAIDSVQDNPYNTYTQPGLPPGPIGAPGEAALDAALHPADEDYLYFVAWPDGSHVFTRTLTEHNRAKAAAQRELRRLRSDTGGQ